MPQYVVLKTWLVEAEDIQDAINWTQAIPHVQVRCLQVPTDFHLYSLEAIRNWAKQEAIAAAQKMTEDGQ